MNLPNLITASRLVLVMPFAYLLFAGYPRWTLFVTFAVAAATDLLDGYLARRLDQVTSIGAWLDQMIDRTFTVAIVLVLLVHDVLTDGSLPRSGQPLPLLLGLASTRELLALPGVLIVIARGARLYHVEYVGKVTTFVQGVTLAAIILDTVFAYWLALACAVVGFLAAVNYTRYSLGATTPSPGDLDPS